MDFAQLLDAHFARYPAMQPQDALKLAYQSACGPAHLVADESAAAAAIAAEWDAGAELPPMPPEPVSDTLCRFHLTGPHTPADAALLARLFRLTAQSFVPEPLEACLEAVAARGMAQDVARYRALGCPPLHHSDAFRAAYAPRYRLLALPYAQLFPALRAAAILSARPGQAMLAIDGRCGSGKTYLASLLQQVTGCNVLHADDFYLPVEARAPDWRRQPGGNMDFARLGAALEAARSGGAVTFRPYSCQRGCLLAPVTLAPQPLTVLEGSYSQHPALGQRWDARIFLTCAPAVQQARLQAREGDYFAAFQSCWIPLEEQYFAACGTERQATLLLDTSGFG